jgi:hypothetical protein
VSPLEDTLAKIELEGWHTMMIKEEPGGLGARPKMWVIEAYPGLFGSHFHGMPRVVAYGAKPIDAARECLKLILTHPDRDLYDEVLRAFQDAADVRASD